MKKNRRKKTVEQKRNISRQKWKRCTNLHKLANSKKKFDS